MCKWWRDPTAHCLLLSLLPQLQSRTRNTVPQWAFLLLFQVTKQRQKERFARAPCCNHKRAPGPFTTALHSTARFLDRGEITAKISACTGAKKTVLSVAGKQVGAHAQDLMRTGLLSDSLIYTAICEQPRLESLAGTYSIHILKSHIITILSVNTLLVQIPHCLAQF